MLSVLKKAWMMYKLLTSFSFYEYFGNINTVKKIHC